MLDCASNQLSSLNVKNGNNTAITSFKARTNSNLTCIEVDDAVYSTTNWTDIDATASFSTNCVATPVVNIPDGTFRAYLLGNLMINTNGDASIQVSEASAFGGIIDCSNLNVTDLTGIEAFVNSANMGCYSNKLSNWEMTKQLINLSVYPNPTTKDITLDFGKFYQEVKIQVTNLTGQIVLSQQVENMSNTTIELQGAAGIYFVNIQTEEGTVSVKVIKK
jgi:hypothetical protein